MKPRAHAPVAITKPDAAGPRQSWRRWLQIRLRTLMILFLLFAVLFGVVGMRLEYAREQSRAVDDILEHGGVVSYGWAWPVAGQSPTAVPPQVPQWLAEWLGQDFFLNVVEVDLSDPFRYPDVDAALPHLKPLVHVRVLRLCGDSCTDAGLNHLKSLRRLEVLELHHTAITDAGLKRLPRLTRLRELDVRSTRVTEESLLRLGDPRALGKLYLIDTPVSPSGVRRLREAFPNAKIYDRPWRTSGEPYP